VPCELLTSLFVLLIDGSRFNAIRPRLSDYRRTGARDVTVTWPRCRRSAHRQLTERHADTVRFIAVAGDIRSHDNDNDDEMALSAAGDKSWSQFDTLRVVLISVWIVVDVLLLVRRLTLIVVALREILVQPAPYDALMTSRACVTWPPTVDQSQQPLAARQNGGPYYATRPTSDDVITASRDLSSPEVVRVFGDVALVYVAVTVGTACLLAAALCACAALLDYFLSAIARCSFVLPVSTYFRSAVEFLVSESRHLSAASRTAVEQRYELTSLQHIMAIFNKGLMQVSHSHFSASNFSHVCHLTKPVNVRLVR